MKAALLSLCLSALLCAAAQARIGETRAQLADRYGAGKEIGEQVLYTSDRYAVTVFFGGDDKAAMEIFGMRPKADGTPRPITPDDCDAFLHQEGQGKHWDLLNLPSAMGGGVKTWRREDGKVFARFIPGQQAFVVMGMDGINSAPMPGVNQIAPGQPMPTTPAP